VRPRDVGEDGLLDELERQPMVWRQTSDLCLVRGRAAGRSVNGRSRQMPPILPWSRS
jgi:hypothetical protein